MKPLVAVRIHESLVISSADISAWTILPSVDFVANHPQSANIRAIDQPLVQNTRNRRLLQTVDEE
jgi:hypothetical protein